MRLIWKRSLVEVFWVFSTGGEGEDEDSDWRDLNLRTSGRLVRLAGVLNRFLLSSYLVWSI